jgi:hypothetical protein
MLRRVRSLTLIVLLTLAACKSVAAPPARSVAPEAQPTPAWPSELFLTRPEGDSGPLIAYDMADGRERFTLPPGLLTANQSHYFTAQVNAGQTQLNSYDPQANFLLNQFTLEGEWALSGVSPSGRWIALTRLISEATRQT